MADKGQIHLSLIAAKLRIVLTQNVPVTAVLTVVTGTFLHTLRLFSINHQPSRMSV